MKMKTGTVVAIAISGVLLVAGVAVGVTAQFGSWECERKATELSVPYTWDLAAGCYLETSSGKWVPAGGL